jgi:peptide/nickel transport system substrate-binding protein
MAKSRLTLAASLFATGIALLVVAGCGGGGGNKSEESQAPATTTTGTTAAVQGGTATFNLQSDTDFSDPALAYYQVSWQFEYSTCAKLLNYPDKPAPEGSQLVPEVATAMPTVSADGKTYTFTVRKGFKFSPPSNQIVTAQTFKFVFERDLNPRMQSPASSFMGDVLGADAMLAGKAKSLSGVTVNGDKLTIKLTAASPDFISRIAMPFFCAIPTTTPINPNGVDTVAGAGPYYISERTPNRRIVLKRNPNYTGDRPHNLSSMVYTVGVSPEATRLQVEKGDADYAADGVPPASYSQLGSKYGPGTQAAKDGKQQLFVNPILSFRYLALNTSRPLFSDAKLRQAVNYAINRKALLIQRGAYAGRTTDQYLPPGLAAYKDEQIYPLEAPDLAKAKELAGSKPRGTAILYTCNVSPCPEQAQIVQQNLKQIGIDVEIRQFTRATEITKTGTKGEPFDIDGGAGWLADYADPFDFINVLLDGTNIQKANNVNISYFDDPTFNKRMREASLLTGTKRDEAYGQLDVDLARNAAPLAAWDNDNQRDFFSARVGCQIYQPIYGMDLNALCMRQ